ncbi:MAG: AHH domain-containing protein [Erysipelotrichales bacterium]|nr:AHH domain-containing protein [Erysipelotrichales bacterium]
MQRLTNNLGMTVDLTVRNINTGTIFHNPSSAFIDPNNYLFLRITDGVLFNQLDHIANMKIRFQTNFRSAGSRVIVREVTNNISGGITLTTSINVGGIIAEYLIPNQPQLYTFELDLTELARRWRGNSNVSRAIRLEVIGSVLISFPTSTNPYEMLVLEEVSPFGLSSNQDLSDFSYGFAGTSFVNNFTGGLTHFFEGFSTTAVKNPISIGAFNTNRRPNIITRETKSLPGGWRMSYDYGVTITTNRITIVSADQTVIHYQRITRNQAAEVDIITNHQYIFVNLDDFSYIERSGDALSIIDSDKNEVILSDQGLIRSIRRNDGSVTTFLSVNNRITVIEADGHEVFLEYNASNFLQRVNFINEHKRLEFDYDGIHTLRSIRFINYAVEPNQTLFIARYEYNTSAWLTRVIDERTNRAALINYFESRVTRVTNQTVSPLRNGKWMDLIWRADINSTIIRDFTNKSVFHYYSKYGFVIQKIDDELNATATEYSMINTSGSQVPQANSITIDHSQAEILNHSFNVVDPYDFNIIGSQNEPRLFRWYADDYSTVKISTGGIQGRQILRVSQQRNRANTIRQTIRLNAGTYNLSFYVRTIHMSGSVNVSVRFGNSNPSVNIIPRNSGWNKRTINNIFVSGNNTLVTIEINCDNLRGGFIYFDNFQTSNNEITKSTLISNGFFNYGTANWDGVNDSIINFGQVVNLTISPPLNTVLGGRAFQFNPTTTRQVLFQRLLVSGNAYDSLSLVSWIRGDICRAAIAKVIILLHGDTTETFEFDFKDQSKDWQMVVSKIMPTRKFNRITLEYHYQGELTLLISGIQMFQIDSGSYYNYDLKGNLLTLAESTDTRTTINYDSFNRVIQNIDDAGNITRFYYDEKRRLETITDQNQNRIDFTFDDNNNVINTKIEAGSNILSFNQNFNNQNQLIRSEDEFGNQTLINYDYLGRVQKQTDPLGTDSEFRYDESGNLITYRRLSGNQSSTNNYQYNNDLTIRSVSNSDARYNFNYDEWGRLTQVLAGNIVVQSYRYDRLFNGINSGLITRQMYGNNQEEAFDFIYNDNNLIDEIRFGRRPLVKYQYNELNQVMKSFSDLKGETYFSYDGRGNLIKEVNGSKTFGFEYDNLNMPQKFSYNINDTVRSYDFEYAYESAGYNSLGLRERIARTFLDDDLSTFRNQLLGAHGFRPTTELSDDLKFDDYFGENYNIIQRRIVNYDLNTVNSRRADLPLDWHNKFADEKSVYGWFTFESIVNEDVFLSLNFGVPRISISVRTIGNQYHFRLRTLNPNGSIAMTSDDIQVSRNQAWHFIGLNISNGNIFLQVNNESLTISLINNPRLLNGLTLGNSQGIIGVYMLGIGATRHTNQSFNAMISQMRRMVESRNNVIPKTGVQFERSLIYNDFHTVTLNGTFTSKFGVKPIITVDMEREFNLDKLRLFEYDLLNQKHVYGSYDGSLSLSANRSALAYKFEFRHMGSMSIRFKPVLMGGNSRIIFENVSGNERFGVRLNQDNTLVLFTTRHSINMPGFTCNMNEWYTVAITWGTNRFTMFVNNRQVSLTDFMNYTDVQTNIGASITKQGVSSNWLNGQLEMLTFTPYLPNNNKIMALLNNNPFMSVKAQVDSLGRKTKEVINTGTAKIESDYLYNNPGNDSTTSLQIGEIRRSNNSNVKYERDKLGNITLIDYGNQTQEFEYDYLSRLTKEVNSKSDLTTLITYTENGNILTKNIFESGGYPDFPIESYTYKYDQQWPDRLIEIYDNVGEGTYQNFNYDSNYAGNPSHIGVGVFAREFNWEGRNLTNVNFRTFSSSFDIRYGYDEKGIRIAKNVNGQITRYELNGSDIILERTGNQTIRYHYNEEGLLVGFEFNDRNYFYVRDVLGIITEIINEEGNVEVSYRYDAWGRIISVEPFNSPIDQINNFVYKGYYRDRETNYYYLKSRYYDARLARFINADGVGFLDLDNIGGLNLFVYCGNNPIINWDPSGSTFFIMDIGRKSLDITKKGGRSGGGPIRGVVLASSLVVGGAWWLGSNTAGGIRPPSSTPVSPPNSGTNDSTGSTTNLINFRDSVAAMTAFIAGLVLSSTYGKPDEKHHIVAQYARRAQGSRDILAEHGIKINNPINLIMVNYRMHRVMHTNVYHRLVYRSLKWANRIGGQTAVENTLRGWQGILGTPVGG